MMAHYGKNTVPLRYDADALNENVPIRDAIERYAGIDTSVRGSINCPSPAHIDKKPSAYIYDRHPKNNCYCFSCNRNFTPISLVMECTNSSFPEACQILIRDFGLSMSRFSNIDEVERAREKAQGAAERNEFYEVFPLDNSDCQLIGVGDAYSQSISNPNYEEEMQFLEGGSAKKSFARPSLVQMWEDDKAGIEEMLLGICEERLNRADSLIYAEKQAFFDIYSLHTAAEWQEAEKLLDARKKFNIGMFGNIKMTAKQRHYIDDISELQKTAERVADYEDLRMEINKIREKILKQADERKMYAKKDVPSIDR